MRVATGRANMPCKTPVRAVRSAAGGFIPTMPSRPSLSLRQAPRASVSTIARQPAARTTPRLPCARLLSPAIPFPVRMFATQDAASQPQSEVMPPPPGTSLVVNLHDKRVDDSALGVRTFVISSLDAAKRFPSQVQAATWPGENEGRCNKCKGVVTSCVVTTFPMGEIGAAAEAQERVWAAHPVALDGVVCRTCSALTAPRFVTPEEYQKLSNAGAKEAKARNFPLAEFMLRRCANAFPEYLYSRLNLGSLFMDRLSAEEQGKDRDEVRKKLLQIVKLNFEACLRPDTKPHNRVPAKVYTTLARIYLSEEDPYRAAMAIQRLLNVAEKLKAANDKEALDALDFFSPSDITYAQSLLSKALSGLQAAAIKGVRLYAYYGDAEARPLSEQEHATLSAAIDTLNLVLHYLKGPPEKYGYLLNVDRYALFYFMGKAMQVMGDRKQAAGWFLEAHKNAQTKERRIEAVTEYAGDFLHCRTPGESREHVDKAIELLKETKEKCGDPDGNLGASLGMLYLTVGNANEAEETLQRCAMETGASLAKGLLAYVSAARTGGSEKWRWEKSGNRLYITTGDEKAPMKEGK